MLASFAVLLSCLVAASSCRASPESVGDHPEAIDADRLPTVVLAPELDISGLGNPDAYFTFNASVAVDESGYLYVLNSRDLQIHAYSPTGTLVRTFGRRGGGPGEFTNTPRIGVRGDTVWSIEWQPRRLTLYQRDGTLLGTDVYDEVSVALQPVPLAKGLPGRRALFPRGTLVPHVMTEAGFFVSDLHRSWSRSAAASGLTSADTVSVPRVRFSVRGAVIDTIGWESHAPPETIHYERIRVRSHTYGIPPPPSDAPLSVTASDGRWVVERRASVDSRFGTFRVTRFDLRGDTVFSRLFRYQPQPYDEVQLDSIAMRAAWSPGVVHVNGVSIIGIEPRSPQSREDFYEARDRIRDTLRFPRYQAPIQDVWLGSDNALWLKREWQTGGIASWILIGRDQIPRSVDLPVGSRIVWSDDDVLWLVTQDDIGAASLIRYRLRRGHRLPDSPQ